VVLTVRKGAPDTSMDHIGMVPGLQTRPHPVLQLESRLTEIERRLNCPT
jgi:hypothetical protein